MDYLEDSSKWQQTFKVYIGANIKDDIKNG